MGFHFPVRVYWEDTDAGGIVFYANYLKFMERARTEWLRSLGISQQRLRAQWGGMFVVTHSQLSYLKPARLDDWLHVSASLHTAGRASLTIAQQVLAVPETPAVTAPEPEQAEQAELLCEGSIRIGWVDAASMRPHRIPPDVLEKLASFNAGDRFR